MRWVSRTLYAQVEDADKWIKGFWEHATNKEFGKEWGVDAAAKYTRSELCDESKTRVRR